MRETKPKTRLKMTGFSGRNAVRGVAVVEIEDVESERELRTLAGHSREVNSAALTADGRLAVSASSDSTLKVWDLQSGRELRVLSGHSFGVWSVAVTGDAQRAVSTSWDRTVKVWDLEAGRELRTLAGHSAEVRGVARCSLTFPFLTRSLCRNRQSRSNCQFRNSRSSRKRSCARRSATIC